MRIVRARTQELARDGLLTGEEAAVPHLADFALHVHQVHTHVDTARDP